MKYVFSLLLIGSWLSEIKGQDTLNLSLEDCLQAAITNNLDLKRAINDRWSAEASRFQSVMTLLPSINASINYDYFFGTTFDQNAARQVTATTNSSNPNVAANWQVFNGLSNHWARIQQNNLAKAADQNVENTKLTTQSNVIAAYLEVILSSENLKISEQRVLLLESQLERAVKRESVGVGGMEEVYNFRSQLANEKLTRQTLFNQWERNKLLLLQVMQVEGTKAYYNIIPVKFSNEDIESNLPSFHEVLTRSLENNPAIKQSIYNERAAKYRMMSISGSRLPRVSILGVFGSNFSSNGAINPDKPFTNPDTGDPGFNFEPNATYLEQMRYNQFEYLNLQLSVPIFNQYQINTQTQQAKIGRLNSELAKKQAEQSLTNLIQQVYLDQIAAQATYQTAKENLVALSQNFDFMKKRYETGNTDFFLFLEALNNKNRAELQLVNAQYSILLRRRILELYINI